MINNYKKINKNVKIKINKIIKLYLIIKYKK